MKVVSMVISTHYCCGGCYNAINDIGLLEAILEDVRCDTFGEEATDCLEHPREYRAKPYPPAKI